MRNGASSGAQSYTAAVVTYRRAGSLSKVLEGLLNQTSTPSLTVIADNDPGQSARELVESLRDRWPAELVYAPVGENLGPAGGWAHAVTEAASHTSHRGEWVLVIDDDDPIESPDLVAGLLREATRQPQRLAGVGLRGSCWDSRRARLILSPAAEGDVDQVHYLAGNGAPLYAWAAIEAVGFFKSDLFFGFEDLELGFRLRKAGWILLAAPRPSVHHVADTGGVRTPWREYYKTRALLWILREHVGIYAVVLTLLRSVLLGGLRLGVVRGRPSLLRARLWGAWDGLSGNLGVRRYSPSSNPPKSARDTDT